MLRKLILLIPLVVILFFICLFFFIGYSGGDVSDGCIYKGKEAPHEIARNAVHKIVNVELRKITLINSFVSDNSYRYKFSVDGVIYLVIVDRIGCVLEIERIR